jgi:N-dimethylarginine dimethylaminohydrolase
MKTYGSQSMIAPVRRMLLKHPREAFKDQANVDRQWEGLHYLGRPDFEAALGEYGRFADLLGQFGMEIHYLPGEAAASLDSIYTHDPVIVTNRGAVLGNMGKAAREPEPAAAGEYLEEIGVPIWGHITGSGRMEGGDVLWIDERTVAVGQGYRTNAEGTWQLKELLGGAVDEVIPVPMPHWTGPDDCLHLMSFISVVDADLAVVYSRLMPVPFRQWLLERGFQLVEAPDEEYNSFGCNVLAVAPRQCLMLSGNPVTQQRLEAAGAQVWTFDGAEIALKGTGGPTCLTRPILRE